MSYWELFILRSRNKKKLIKIEEKTKQYIEHSKADHHYQISIEGQNGYKPYI